MVLVAHHQSPVVLQPSEKTFNFPSSAISSQRPSVLCFPTLPASTMWSDHLGAQSSRNRPSRPSLSYTLSPINRASTSLVNPESRICFDQSHFMRRSAGHVHGDRKTCSVCHCHDLAALAPLGFAHDSAPFFAGANVPSMKASRKSMQPRSRRPSARAARMRSKTPSLRQRWNQRWQVWYGGYRSGKSFQGAPVLRIHKMSSSTSRGGVEGRPCLLVRLWLAGSGPRCAPTAHLLGPCGPDHIKPMQSLENF